MALAACGSSFTVDNSCFDDRILEGEKGSYLIGTDAWKKATTAPDGSRLWINPAMVEQGGFSIIGEDFGEDLAVHNRYLYETCPEVFKRAELLPAE